MLALVVILPVTATFLLSIALINIFQVKIKGLSQRQHKRLTFQLKELFSDKNPQQMVKLYFIFPIFLAVAALLVFKSVIMVFIAAVVGLAMPTLILRLREIRRKQAFNNQILDAIMILSSSLKGGLSLLQALEVLVEEMPAPMNQEMGLVVRENKMGMTLEESLQHLRARMGIEELGLVINSILVARETGGDLTKVLSRLSTTIRDNRKLKDSIRTLTMQGRMQGLIMSGLPLLFVWWVFSFNRQHFNIMLQSELGRTLIFVAVILQGVGMVLIHKFSSINI